MIPDSLDLLPDRAPGNCPRYRCTFGRGHISTGETRGKGKAEEWKEKKTKKAKEKEKKAKKIKRKERKERKEKEGKKDREKTLEKAIRDIVIILYLVSRM